MTVIHSFRQKQREKEIKLERNLLRELSIEWLKKKTLECFIKGIDSSQYIPIYQLEECCQDVAVEAFLLGGRFGKFGYYGESVEEVKSRCQEEEKYLIDTLYHYIEIEGLFEKRPMIQDSLYLQCEQYVHAFWMEGFLKAVKRYKLKLKS
ncbi:YbaK family protein [Bacillus carboniphilus]|uniref:YbaK family protein n=1 Tax=Bacillus carboniphilus TaxID=86663 RepID=A0ABP3FQV5_9BACI